MVAVPINPLILNDRYKTMVAVPINHNSINPMAGDPKKIINELIYRYKNFFGDIAVKVSKNAAYNLTMKLPPEEVPDSLR